MCTGNINSYSVVDINFAVYPCVYREHVTPIPPFVKHCDLSLCVQGTQMSKPARHRSTRFIPVCTGNTFATVVGFVVRAVYPCVYREHWLLIIAYLFIFGLSLCVQGTQQVVNTQGELVRFIPVCTGNTIFSNFIYYLCSVYPCVYREHTT